MSLVVLTTLSNAICFSDEISNEIMTGYDWYFWNTGVISLLDIPGKNWYYFEWWNELIIVAKEILARAIEYLPVIILAVLLLACVKIIFDWDWKEWLKRIKYILIWVGLMILSVYLVNILSTIFFWHPVLNINFHSWL